MNRTTMNRGQVRVVATEHMYYVSLNEECDVADAPVFIVHDGTDDVAVVVRDVAGGEQIAGRTLGDDPIADLTANGDVPLGHKIALHDIDSGAEVVKYGVAIGVATMTITTGDHVHTHNVRSTRWPGN